MNATITLSLLLLGSVLAAGCSSNAPVAHSVPAPDSADVQRVRAAANALGGDLMTLLKSELERGGPGAAIAVCADSAQVRTQAHQRDGVTVRRVGTRLRNPGNSPDSLEAAVLAAFEADRIAGRLPAETLLVVATPEGGAEIRYLKPIALQEPCLACHGPADRLSPPVRALLAERYPADEATGYAAGDLRGAISVRAPLAARAAH